MPANLTTLAHFSVSAAMRLPKPVGVIAVGTPPKSANRAFVFGSAFPAPWRGRRALARGSPGRPCPDASTGAEGRSGRERPVAVWGEEACSRVGNTGDFPA